MLMPRYLKGKGAVTGEQVVLLNKQVFVK